MGEKMVNINDLYEFKGNPYSVRDDEEMEILTESIKQYGIIEPLLVIKREEGGYEILSGHRRKYACEKAGIERVPVLVRDMNRNMAIITLVDSNLQRENILPSEKAFAYKMKLEAMKKQGFRTDLTSDQLGQKSTSVDKLAEKSNASKTQIQRYIRLTYLKKPLLDLVDEGRISFTPAVELSYLKDKEQQDLIQTIESEDATPSLSQAQRMKKLSAEDNLSMDKIFEIMTEVKGNQIEVIKVPTSKISKYFKANASNKQIEDTIIKALEYYHRKLMRDKNKER